jgi:hypothetical protein
VAEYVKSLRVHQEEMTSDSTAVDSTK